MNNPGQAGQEHMETRIGATAYARRFGAIYLCGHALDGDGDPISLEQAQAAEHRAYHWQPCLNCLRGGTPAAPSSLRYTMAERHPFAPPANNEQESER